MKPLLPFLTIALLAGCSSVDEPNLTPLGEEDHDCPDAEKTVWYDDLDGDSFGGAFVYLSCASLAGAVDNALDCDDYSPERNPDAAEVCDGLDTDCNGVIDDVPSPPSWWPDTMRDRLAG